MNPAKVSVSLIIPMVTPVRTICSLLWTLLIPIFLELPVLLPDYYFFFVHIYCEKGLIGIEQLSIDWHHNVRKEIIIKKIFQSFFFFLGPNKLNLSIIHYITWEKCRIMQLLDCISVIFGWHSGLDNYRHSLKTLSQLFELWVQVWFGNWISPDGSPCTESKQ